jgi:Fe-S cluster assembly protein SufD
MQTIAQNIRWYRSQFDEFEKSLNGEKTNYIHTLRRDAIQRFSELGFPTNRQEDWRFINIAPITSKEFKPVFRYDSKGIKKQDLQKYLIDKAIQLVFIDGMFSPEYSTNNAAAQKSYTDSLSAALIKNTVEIKSNLGRQVTGTENAFTALNAAFLQDGAYVSIPAGVKLEHPIQFLFVATDSQNIYTTQPRNLVVVNTDAQLNIIETYVGLGENTYLTNSVSEVFIAEGAKVEYDKFQIESPNSYHIGTLNIKMGNSSQFISNAFSFGGAIVRNNITAMLDAEGSECTLNGLSLGKGQQIVDNHTAIDHAKPNCQSHELYKAILDGESRGIFNGKIFVRKDAQKTDAKQTNRTLLLSDNATINAKPQLEIFADDVKCTHGATIGQLDADQLFYLRSRGIDLSSARAILTTAFAGDVINRVRIESLRNQLDQVIRESLM